MNDYERIALILRHLDGCPTGQPDLAALAGIVGLSPFHFHMIRETGVVGDYRWGRTRKRVVLAWESAPLFRPTHANEG